MNKQLLRIQDHLQAARRDVSAAVMCVQHDEKFRAELRELEEQLFDKLAFIADLLDAKGEAA